ncbi:MAG TPA: MBOAT family O-acyltransferase [Vicinamibacterales bacterium]|nr:MBOAT family O-acyltransferase [Vicinamibacterales bacterium]
MLFNSALFLLLFFPLVTILYYVVPQPARWRVLLVASCYFYAVGIPAYLLVLAAIIAIDYTAGLTIERSTGRRRTAVLVISLASNVLLLGVFKYADFLAGNLTTLAGLLGWNYSLATLGWLLPIGLSFHTFQSMAYTIEVYKGAQPAERHFGYFALYVLFYPQLVAGPIERPQHLLPQLHRPPLLSARGLRGGLAGLSEPCIFTGLQLMLLGLFKKMVIADRLALAVDPVYSHPHLYPATALLIATAFFAIQIYCDFSGYTHIARGAALTMGVDLSHNFMAPYGAHSVGEFWRRWHISLSSWFRDYVYVPLGGNRVSHATWVRNVLITFFLSGLWHGADWTFITWGLVHACYLIVSRGTVGIRATLVSALHLDALPRLHAAMQALIVLALVTFAWIFFRAESMADAWFIVRTIPAAGPELLRLLREGAPDGVMVRLGVAGLPIAKNEWALMFMLAIAVVAFDQRRWRQPLVLQLSSYPRWAHAAAAYALIFGVLFFGVYRTATFIYFQF